MVITLKCMTVDATVLIAVVSDNLLQLDRSLGQYVDGEGNIFDEAARAHRAHAADGGEDALTDGPITG